MIGIAQTGTGKTAAFVLPILAKLAAQDRGGQKRSIRVLVVAPTRELVVQIEENVRAYAPAYAAAHGDGVRGVGEHPQIEALRSGVDIVVATPGRLLDLMGRRNGDFSGIQFLVLDEADRMLDMGFLPDIRRIVKALPSEAADADCSRRSLSQGDRGVTREFQQAPKMVQIGRRANPAETVTQFVYEVPQAFEAGPAGAFAARTRSSTWCWSFRA